MSLNRNIAVSLIHYCKIIYNTCLWIKRKAGIFHIGGFQPFFVYLQIKICFSIYDIGLLSFRIILEFRIKHPKFIKRKVRTMDAYQDRIRELREDRGLTQREIADVLSTTQQVYSKYERGVLELPIRHLITLCTYYGVSADYILCRRRILKKSSNR